MEFLHENPWGYHDTIRIDLGQFMSDLVTTSQNTELFKAIEVVFQLAELLEVQHHFLAQP
jgi:hypothetical protein